MNHRFLQKHNKVSPLKVVFVWNCLLAPKRISNLSNFITFFPVYDDSPNFNIKGYKRGSNKNPFYGLSDPSPLLAYVLMPASIGERWVQNPLRSPKVWFWTDGDNALAQSARSPEIYCYFMRKKCQNGLFFLEYLCITQFNRFFTYLRDLEYF